MDELDEALDNFEFRLDDEGVEYTILHYSNWKEFETLAPDLYEKIVSARKAIGDMLLLLESKYGRGQEL